MVIDFYYWSYQCPLNYDMKALLASYESEFEIHYYDIAQDFDLAKKMRMYFPTLIVIDGIRRYFSPITYSFMESLRIGILPEEEPYVPTYGTVEINNDTNHIDAYNLVDACACSGGCSECAIQAKTSFYASVHEPLYGMIMKGEKHAMLGGAEYVPSCIVPYDIPRNEKTAFITCVYPTHEQNNYKREPLRRLEVELSKSYQDVYVISDEKSTFPNGNLMFFLENGYVDQGIISIEETYCTLHLLYKML